MALSLTSLPSLAFPQANINSDISPQLAAIGDAIKTGQQRRTLAELGQGLSNGTLNYDQAAAQLLASGDRAGAMSLAQLGMNQAQQSYNRSRDAINDKYRVDQATQTQRNWEASYGLQKRAAARADEDQYSVQKVENPDGTTSLVRVAKRGTPGVIDTGMPQQAGGNPFAPGKFNEGQGKAAGFTDRMLQSEGILSGIGGQGGVQNQGTSITGAALDAVGNTPYIGGIAGAGANWLKGPERQKYEQAKRDFVNAQLRRESGAAISPSEFDSANKQYFPVPGDSPEVIKQKSANRRAAIEAMGREGGPSYRPKYVFDDQGRVVARPTQQAQQPQASKPQQQFRDGQRARNASGQIIEFRGGQWVPAQ